VELNKNYYIMMCDISVSVPPDITNRSLGLLHRGAGKLNREGSK